MRIHYRLFAVQAESVGAKALTAEVTDGAMVADAVTNLRALHPDMPWPQGTLVAVNQQYVAVTEQLHPEDELAIIPPVSGG